MLHDVGEQSGRMVAVHHVSAVGVVTLVSRDV